MAQGPIGIVALAQKKNCGTGPRKLIVAWGQAKKMCDTGPNKKEIGTKPNGKENDTGPSKEM